MKKKCNGFPCGMSLGAILLIVLSPLAAQEIKFKHLSIEDGLSQSTIHCVLQDHRGFMWFGTQDGLNCYDGYRFTVYRPDPADSNSISDNYVRTLFEDSRGRLWIGTDGGGLNVFDSKTKTFSVFKNNPKDSTSLSVNIVWSIYEDRSGRLWIGTDGGGLNLFDDKTKKFIAFKNDPRNPASLSDNTVTSIYEDHSGQLWIGTGDGLNLFDAKTKTFGVFKNDPKDIHSLSSNSVWSVYEDRSGLLWVGTTGGGLNLYDAGTKKFSIFKNDPKDPNSLSNNRVRSIYEDHSGRLWVGTFGGGINLYDAKAKTFSVFKNDPQDPLSLSNNEILSICEDHSGGLWVGTYSGGLNHYDARAKSFVSFKSDSKVPSSLSSGKVRSICEDHFGRLWVGTDGGLNLYDAKLKTFSSFKNDPGDPSSLSNDAVFSVYEDRSARLWVGTDGGGLLLFNQKNRFRSFKNDVKDPSSLSGNRVRSIYEDHFGLLWIGTDAGLNLLDESTMTFRSFKNSSNDPTSLSSNRVRSIYEDQSGQMWIGTDGGLNLFDAKTKTFRSFKNDPKDPSSLSDNSVRSIYEDQSGRLWIGTFGGGLNLFDAKTQSFKAFRERQGLPNDVIYGILEDGHGRLWLSTNNGLSRFTPSSDLTIKNGDVGMFRNYDASDGLLSNEFNQNAYFKSKNGWMYFGGINGLNAFHPDSIKDEPYLPPIVLTGLEIFNKPVNVLKEFDNFVLPVSVTEADELVLSYKESVFTLEFSSLIFAQPMKNKYAYRLDDFDKDWNYTDAKRRFATYTNLDPGTYTFRVKGSNHDGIWNEESRALKITITSPWWRLWYANIFYGLCIVALLYGIRQFEINRERQKAQVEKLELRARAAEDQSRSQQTDVENSKKIAVINQELEQAILGLKQAQTKLVQTEKMASLGQMTAGIAHEINNPLTFVYGNLEFFKLGFEKILQWIQAVHNSKTEEARRMALDELAREISLLGEEMSGQLNTTLSGAGRIKDIVENLRKFSRVGESESMETNVNADLERIIDLFVKQHSGIRIDRQFSEPLRLVVNVSELNQCYLNILTNSIQAIRESEKQGMLLSGEGVITIRTESVNMEQKKWIRVTFTDNGIGIADLHKDKIFDPFFTTRAIGQGRGLGLAEAYGIIHKHQGTIEVSSAVGKGTTISIALPT